MTPLSMLASMFGWVLAALMVGLWWGERGRRRAAERREVSGSPEEAAPAAVSRAPAKEAEDRYLDSVRAVSDETIDRFYDDAVAQLKAEGTPFDPKTLRGQIANRLMHGEDVLE